MRTPLRCCLLLMSLSCLPALAQNTSSADAGRGKAIIQIHTNFHSGFGSQNDDRGFDLERAYLGYEYNVGNGLALKAVIDVGAKTDDNDRATYIKSAQGSWRKNEWTLNAGMITTTQFKVQESFWGYRYMYKSFQDEYKFGSSADLGISVSYKPLQWLEADAIVVNGEGYKKVQYNDGLQYGLGVTFKPIDGLSLRIYGSLNEQPDAKDVINLAAFAGYSYKWLSIGAEYNYMQNYQGVDNQDRYGMSLYGTIVTSKYTDVFLRYDNISSKKSWSKEDDEQMLLGGAEMKLGKYIKIAPNFRLSIPKDDTPNRYSVYISCYAGL